MRVFLLPVRARVRDSQTRKICLHVVLELLQVLLLLCELLLQLQQLLLLALADGVVLVGLLTLGERVASINLMLAHQALWCQNLWPQSCVLPCFAKMRHSFPAAGVYTRADIPSSSGSSQISLGHDSLGGGECSDGGWLKTKSWSCSFDDWLTIHCLLKQIVRKGDSSNVNGRRGRGRLYGIM